MTAILTVRPTLESGIGPCAVGAGNVVSRLAPQHGPRYRKQLACRWRLARDGSLVCIWELGMFAGVTRQTVSGVC
jgi:hypothetical protein